MLYILAGHSNNCQIMLKLLGYDICSAILCRTEKFQASLEVSEVLIIYITNKGKARVMLHIGAGHSNNCHIILNWFDYDIFSSNFHAGLKKMSSKFQGIRVSNLFRYDIFCNNLQHKKFQANLEVSEVLITSIKNRGRPE